MGAIRFNVPRSDRPPGEMLARLPRAFRDDAEKGFTVLAGIPSDRYEDIVQRAIVMVESRRPPVDGLEKLLGLTSSDVGNVFAAAMLMVPFVGEGTTPDEFIDAAVKTKLIDHQIVSRLKPFFDVVVAHAKPITEAIKRSAITDQVLPAFYDINIAVDLRIGFLGDRVDIAVPVAVIHIDTDVEDRQLWFQASKRKLLVIRDEIDEALQKMDAAEAWGEREPKP